MDVKIPEACLNPDGSDDCPHNPKSVKRDYNPV